MANIKNLKHFPRSDETVEPLAEKPTQVRLPVSIEQAIRRLENRKSPWLRRVITEAAQRELMGNTPQSGLESDKETGDPVAVTPKRRGRKPKGDNHE